MSDKATKAAQHIVAKFHRMMEMMPLAGGQAYQIETSTDPATVVAVAYLRLRKAAGELVAALVGITAEEIKSGGRVAQQIDAESFDSAHDSLWAIINGDRCIHGEHFPCCQCTANRRWNEAATGRELTEDEFQQQYTQP